MGFQGSQAVREAERCGKGHEVFGVTARFALASMPVNAPVDKALVNRRSCLVTEASVLKT